MASASRISDIIGSIVPAWGGQGNVRDEEIAPPSQEEYERRAHVSLLNGLKALTARNEAKAFEALHAAFISYRYANDGKSASLVQKTISLLIQTSRKPHVVRTAFRSAQRALGQAGLYDEVVRLLMFNAEFEARHRDFLASDHLFIEAIQTAGERDNDPGRIEALCRRAIVAADRGKSSDCKKHVAKAREITRMSPTAECKAVFEKWAPKALAPRSVSLAALSR